MMLFYQMYRLAAEPFFLSNFRKSDFVAMNAAALAVFAVCEALTASADNMFVSYAFNIVLFALYAAYLVRRERIDLGAMLRAFLHR